MTSTSRHVGLLIRGDAGSGRTSVAAHLASVLSKAVSNDGPDGQVTMLTPLDVTSCSNGTSAVRNIFERVLKYSSVTGSLLCPVNCLIIEDIDRMQSDKGQHDVENLVVNFIRYGCITSPSAGLRLVVIVTCNRESSLQPKDFLQTYDLVSWSATSNCAPILTAAGLDESNAQAVTAALRSLPGADRLTLKQASCLTDLVLAGSDFSDSQSLVTTLLSLFRSAAASRL